MRNIRNSAILAALLLLLPISGHCAGGRNGERRNEFELSMGATIGTYAVEEMKNWPFLSFSFEWRHLFLDGALAGGVEGYLSAVPRHVLWEHFEHEADYYSWRNLSTSLTAEYRPFREGLNPFFGAAVGVTQTDDSAPHWIAPDRGVLGLMVAPRIGIQPFRHFRLTAEFRWIPGAPEFNQVGARIGFIF